MPSPGGGPTGRLAGLTAAPPYTTPNPTPTTRAHPAGTPGFETAGRAEGGGTSDEKASGLGQRGARDTLGGIPPIPGRGAYMVPGQHRARG